MKFSKGLMIVAFCAMSFGVITPSSYYERAKAKAQGMYGQAKDMYGQAKDKFGGVQATYDKYGRPLYDKYGQPIKDKYQDLRSKAVDYYNTPSKADRDKEEEMMKGMDNYAREQGLIQ